MCVECYNTLFRPSVQLHKRLAETLQTRDQWREKDKETPQEEKARLLQQVHTHRPIYIYEAKSLTEIHGVCTPQVKKDNEEITSMEKMYVLDVAIFCVYRIIYHMDIVLILTCLGKHRSVHNF